MIPIVPAGAQVRAAFSTPGQLNLPALPPLSLYIHFPWCVRKCPYCDFNSHEKSADGIPEARYLNALRTDLELALPMVWGRPVHTVFIGGGTPSLLSAAGMEQLLSDVRALLPLEADAEITMEANPGTFEAERFRAYRESGINRLSIGIQSFDDSHLVALGRIHGGDEARRAIEIAQRHFDNINLDLMYALPGQTLAQCQTDIETALGFGTSHLSLYHLTLEPNTYFAKFPPALPDDDTSADMQDWIAERTQAAGYEHYEVSAYAQPGRRSKHNLNYWRFGDYLGIGAGAHGKISYPHRVVREARYKHPQTYMEQCEAGQPIQESREPDANALPFEFMLNALRLTDGVPASLFYDHTGLPLHIIQSQLAVAESKGLLFRDHSTIRATPLGQRFLNDLQEIFLSADTDPAGR
jgi:putative oxygen-independent coproporphyrinogen III oxidase